LSLERERRGVGGQGEYYKIIRIEPVEMPEDPGAFASLQPTVDTQLKVY